MVSNNGLDRNQQSSPFFITEISNGNILFYQFGQRRQSLLIKMTSLHKKLKNYFLN